MVVKLLLRHGFSLEAEGADAFYGFCVLTNIAPPPPPNTPYCITEKLYSSTDAGIRTRTSERISPPPHPILLLTINQFHLFSCLRASYISSKFQCPICHDLNFTVNIKFRSWIVKFRLTHIFIGKGKGIPLQAWTGP
jgi:hypothetical protein